MTHFARAVGAARSGDAASAQKDVDELARLRDALATQKDPYWTGQVEIQRLAAQAWIELAQGRHEEALSLLRKSADLQDASEKASVTPGHLAPSRELLGEMLLELKQPSKALQEFEASGADNPNRLRGIRGAALAAAEAGETAKAKTYYARLAQLTRQAKP
jgi:tetratricopeptide (TPR) repeat protein